MNLPLDKMVLDAERLESYVGGAGLTGWASLAGDVSCHVKALVCEVQQLTESLRQWKEQCSILREKIAEQAKDIEALKP